MKRCIVLLVIIVLALSSMACGVRDGGSFQVYEGKIKEIEWPTGSSDARIKLANGKSVYTFDDTRVFDGEHPQWNTVPWYGLINAGDRVRLWMGKEDSQGMYPIYCLMIGLDAAAAEGWTGGFYKLADAELVDGEYRLRDVDEDISIIAAEELIGEHVPAAGDQYFVWHKDGKKASEIRAEYLHFVPDR